MIGRSAVCTRSITFGMVLGLWAFEVKRGVERLERATDQAAVGKISGAVGTYANIDPRVEQIVMRKLELNGEPISTQVVQRDRHAEFLAALALLATTIEKIAVQVRHYQRTECWRQRSTSPGPEGFLGHTPQVQPHHSRAVGGAGAGHSAQHGGRFRERALWHERDISHPVGGYLPDSTILLHYMLKRACIGKTY